MSSGCATAGSGGGEQTARIGTNCKRGPCRTRAQHAGMHAGHARCKPARCRAAAQGAGGRQDRGAHGRRTGGADGPLFAPLRQLVAAGREPLGNVGGDARLSLQHSAAQHSTAGGGHNWHGGAAAMLSCCRQLPGLPTGLPPWGGHQASKDMLEQPAASHVLLRRPPSWQAPHQPPWPRPRRACRRPRPPAPRAAPPLAAAGSRRAPA